jgi:putative inorganic carbon (hco3(-)) transporter
MQSGSQGFTDYEPVTSARRGRSHARTSDEWPPSDDDGQAAGAGRDPEEGNARASSRGASKELAASKKWEVPDALKRGHGLTYLCLFLFTVLLYLRPSEIYPSAVTNNIAFVVGLLTLAVFVPSQLSVEGNLTARPREVNAVLLLSAWAILAMPFAVDPAFAWESFAGTFIRCVVIFIVMVNAVRTEGRLRWLLLLAVLVSCWLSLGALNDYRTGNLAIEGYRVGGHGEGIFGNSNDLALHLVTIAPIAAALAFASRGLARKLFYGGAVLLMLSAVVVTYSRGGFLGMACAFAVLAWKLGRKHRLAVFAGALFLLAGLLVFAPGNYALRLLSILVPNLDPVGSSAAREGELMRSLWVAIRRPVFGVGMGNYVLMSFRSQVTHNAYTQVAAELGLPALACYLLFVVTPLRRMARVGRETSEDKDRRRFYYIAVGLQASLAGYMVSSFFASVAFLWYIYYLVGYAVCFERIYRSELASRETAAQAARADEGATEEATEEAAPAPGLPEAPEA